MAAVALATGTDPMAVLEWPGDIFDAVVARLTGEVPGRHEAEIENLKAFAGQWGALDV